MAHFNQTNSFWVILLKAKNVNLVMVPEATSGNALSAWGHENLYTKICLAIIKILSLNHEAKMIFA